MITTQWRVSPELGAPRTGVWVGAGGEGDGIWLGSVAEIGTGARPKVRLATGKEQVVAVVGKRGSGKSFTLGVVGEGSVFGRNVAARGRRECACSVAVRSVGRLLDHSLWSGAHGEP